MKKAKSKRVAHHGNADAMRAVYDFSHATRGTTASRYAEGTNVILLEPDVARIFPDARSVNEALRTLARLTKRAARGRIRAKRTA